MHRSTCQQQRTKSGRRPAVEPRINRLSTGRFVPLSVYILFRLFVFPKKHARQLFSMPWRARGSVVTWAERPVGVQSCPAPPRLAPPHRPGPPRPDPPRPDPPVVCSGFGHDKFSILGITGHWCFDHRQCQFGCAFCLAKW